MLSPFAFAILVWHADSDKSRWSIFNEDFRFYVCLGKKNSYFGAFF